MITALLVWSSIGVTASSLNSATAATPNTEIRISVVADGSEPFAGDPADEDGLGSHNPGDDTSETNNVVRTFDIIRYRVDWNVNEVDATGAKVVVQLPATVPEIVWAEIPSGCDTTSTISPDGQTLTCELDDQIEGASGTIFPIADLGATRVGIDGSVIETTASVETTEGGAVSVDDPVETTISATPNYDWVKGYPIEYRSITNTVTSEPGRIYVFPLVLRPGDGNRGSEPLDDAQPIQFYDHLYYWSNNGGSTIDGTLITSANAASFTGDFEGRICGGYSGDGIEEERDTGANVPQGLSVPYGVNGLGDITNTTGGAQSGTETVTCTDVTGANSYPITQIDVSGHTTTPPSASAANGSGNTTGIVIATQIAYFISDDELFPTAAGFGYLHNAITGDTTTIPAPTSPFSVPVTTLDPIVTTGTVAIDEATTNNNAVATNIALVPTGGLGKIYRHWVEFNPGPYREAEYVDTDNPGITLNAFDERSLHSSRPGAYGTSGFADNRDPLWQFQGVVSRDQLMTLEMHVSTFSDGNEYGDFQSPLHGCMYVDTTYMELIDFPSAFTVSQIGPNNSGVINHFSPTIGGRTGTPTNGLFHVLYGDSASGFSSTSGTPSFVRHNPAVQPDYVVEVAKAAIPVGNNYDRQEVTCNNDDADINGWTAIDATTDLTVFDPNMDGRYENIDMIRLRTLEPVDWDTPFETLGTSFDRGSNFSLFAQAQVKSTTATVPDGSQLYIHCSRSQGDWPDGVNAPDDSAADCTNGSLGATFEVTTTAWCNLATNPPAAGDSDPIELTNDSDNPTLSHRDTVTVSSPQLYINKSNVDGLADIVDNGDLVTFAINFGVIGGATPDDTIENVTLTDNLNSEFEFVSLDPGSGTCTGTDSISCEFGDQVAPWSDTVTVTVRVREAEANDSLTNRATITGDFNGEVVETYSVAGAYMIAPYHALEVRKEVPDLDGDCDVAPGTVLPSGDCSTVDLNGTLVYNLIYTNTGNVSLENLTLIDVLPFNGDDTEPQTTFYGNSGVPNAGAGTAGDGRVAPSDFSGTTSLSSVTSSLGAIEMTLSAGVDRNPETNSSVWAAGTSAGATAYRVDIPDLGIGESGMITVTIATSGNVEDDIYTNNFGLLASGEPVALRAPGDNGILVTNRSNDVSIMVKAVLGAITGNVSADTDQDMVIDIPLENVILELLDSNGNPVLDSNGLPITTTTDANGDYAFNDVYPGDYTVIEQQPAGYDDQSEIDGGDDGDNPDNGVVNSIPVTVDIGGETDTGNDFVEEQSATAVSVSNYQAKSGSIARVFILVGAIFLIAASRMVAFKQD